MLINLGANMPTKKLSKVQKSNELNQANFSDFSLSCYRVLLNLISKLHRHDLNGDPIPINMVSRDCELTAQEYAKEFGIDGNTSYEILKAATDKLMKTSFSINLSKCDILKINVCSQSHYQKSQGKISIRFTEEIMPHLAELKQNFVMYNLCDIAGFDSIYSVRLYELIHQFKTTGLLEISVSDLRFKLGVGAKYKAYNDFKKFTFAHAVDEINSQYGIGLTYKEIKTGRSVTAIIFTFRRTVLTQAWDPVRKKMRTQCVSKPKKLKQQKLL
jgi:plasmid replication initiation protein